MAAAIDCRTRPHVSTTREGARREPTLLAGATRALGRSHAPGYIRHRSTGSSGHPPPIPGAMPPHPGRIVSPPRAHASPPRAHRVPMPGASVRYPGRIAFPVRRYGMTPGASSPLPIHIEFPTDPHRIPHRSGSCRLPKRVASGPEPHRIPYRSTSPGARGASPGPRSSPHPLPIHVARSARRIARTAISPRRSP